MSRSDFTSADTEASLDPLPVPPAAEAPRTTRTIEEALEIVKAPVAPHLTFSRLRYAPKVLPGAPFARRTTGLGASPDVRLMPSSSSAGVRICGVFVSVADVRQRGTPLHDDEGEKGNNGAPEKKRSRSEEREDAVADRVASASEEGQNLPPRVYFRVVADKSLEVVLPLEVMRERHPQVLIDYLLSTAVYR